MPDCAKCGSTGRWQYDENHSQPCPDCCPHDAGVWYLTEHYLPFGCTPEECAKYPRWCCKAGCGTKWFSIGDYQNRRKTVWTP